MRTLTVTLEDLEGIPHGTVEAGTSITVQARYSREVILTDGSIIPPAIKRAAIQGEGVAAFTVYESDSPDVQEDYRDFAILVEATVATGAARGVTFRRTVKVLTTTSPVGEPVPLGSLPSTEGLPAKWTSISDLMAELSATVATELNDPNSAAYQAVAPAAVATVEGELADPASPARQSINDAASATLTTELADETSNAYAAVVDAAATTTDPAIAANISDPGTETRAALDADFAAVPSNGARAVGKGELVVNVDDHGAVGDGVTDDTTAIRSAISAAQASVSKRLRFTPGKTYGVTGSLDPTGLTVEATGTTLQTLAGAAGHRILRPNGTFTWTGGTLDPNAANTMATGTDEAWFQDDGTWDHITVTDLTILATHGDAFRVIGTSGITDAANAATGPVTLTRVRVLDSGAFAGNISRCAGVTLTDCGSLRGGTAGFILNLCREPVVNGGTYSDTTGTAAAGHGITTMYCLNPRITGVNASGNAGAGVAFGGGSTTNTPTKGGSVVGCVADNNGSVGVYVDTTISGANGVLVEWGGVVSGNACRGNALHGIGLTNTDGATVTGNTCTDNVTNGITCNAANVAIEGNTARGNNRGIAVFSHGEGVRVGANSVTGNITNDYWVGAGVTSAPLFAQMSTTVPTG